MSKKRGSLSRSELYYIQTNPYELSDEELAVELDRGISQVRKVLNDLQKKKEKENQEALAKRTTECIVSTHKETLTQQMMGKVRHQGNKKRIIGAVMTPAASELGDTLRKKSQPSKFMQEATTKIYNE